MFSLNKSFVFRSRLYLSELWDKLERTNWQAEVKKEKIRFWVSEESEQRFLIRPSHYVTRKEAFKLNPVVQLEFVEQQERMTVKMKAYPEASKLAARLGKIVIGSLMTAVMSIALGLILFNLDSPVSLVPIAIISIIIVVLVRLVNSNIRAFGHYRLCLRELEEKIMRELELSPALQPDGQDKKRLE